MSIVFLVALYLPQCRALESISGVRPQLFSDSLKFVFGSSAALLSAAKFTNLNVKLVGQDAAPERCVLPSTSKRVRADMRNWLVSDAGDKWSVRPDVRDSGGHFDATTRAKVATLGCRVSRILRIPTLAALPRFPWQASTA